MALGHEKLEKTFQESDFAEAILQLPVFDTHAHLQQQGMTTVARNFVDVGHYFWLVQELSCVGYPRKWYEIKEADVPELFAAAFPKIRTTMMARLFRLMCTDLFDYPAERELDVRELDGRIRELYEQPGRAIAILDQARIQTVTVNTSESVPLQGAEARGLYLPMDRETGVEQWLPAILEAKDPAAVLDEAKAAIVQKLQSWARAGIPGVRIDILPENLQLLIEPPAALPKPLTIDVIKAHLAHALLNAAAGQGLFIQLFLGMARGNGPSMAAHDSQRIQRLFPVFQHWSECDFELLEASFLNQAAVAQAARCYPNVYAGGLWWFNFRPYAYHELFRTRLDELPPARSCIVATDATTAEWCYAKVMLVKHELALFLEEQVKADRLNRADALWLAREWLHDAAARRYLRPKSS